MDLHFVTLVWEKGISPVSDQPGNIARGERVKIASETTQTTPARLNRLISATVPANLCRSRSREHDEFNRRIGAIDPASTSGLPRATGVSIRTDSRDVIEVLLDNAAERLI
jgi:hypothetical protein